MKEGRFAHFCVPVGELTFQTACMQAIYFFKGLQKQSSGELCQKPHLSRLQNGFNCLSGVADVAFIQRGHADSAALDSIYAELIFQSFNLLRRQT